MPSPTTGLLATVAASLDEHASRFELLEDGGLRTTRMIERMIDTSLRSCERHTGALIAVAFGGDEPVLAVAVAEHAEDWSHG